MLQRRGRQVLLLSFLDGAPRHLLFTGKGGVGKTSLSCAAAVALADAGQRVLLVSTDPASNLDEVLGVPLSPEPRAVPGVPGLSAMNIDPDAAAKAYRERVVGPVRGLLPDAAVASIEEQLSGACTVEIAAFDEFAKLLGSSAATAGFDHVVLDTAPTGHTLRLLELPQAWTGFFEASKTGASCLGPLSGMTAQRALYEATRNALADPSRTRLVMVSRPEAASLAEAARASDELRALGISDQHLALNGLFRATDRDDAVALALEARGAAALETLAPGLAALERTTVPLQAGGLVGLAALRALAGAQAAPPEKPVEAASGLPASLASLVDELARSRRGVVMAMGKGGVGKTTIASAIAVALAQRGLRVRLTTTDPAAHLAMTLGAPPDGITLGRIDPAEETRRYREEILRTAGAGLDAAGRALLTEDLASPCTEESAVFRAFAREVDEAEHEVVVFDTAPTGHTLLLLDATETYHREVLRLGSQMPAAVRALLPRLRDPSFTRVVLVTLPEATPVHEAAALEDDLGRAGIRPFAWVVNQSLAAVRTADPLLQARQGHEAPFIAEVVARAARCALVPWRAAPPVGAARLGALASHAQVVLFACVHNAGRSQMAAALFNQLADPARARARSAGTQPGPRVHPEVVLAMRELGLELEGVAPQRLTPELAAQAQWLVTMGCGDDCPVGPETRRDDWPLPDPRGQPLERVREIRDDVRRRVLALLDQQGWR